MDNTVCPITKTQNPFIPNLEVAVQVDGTVMGVGVLLITKTPSLLWGKKGSSCPSGWHSDSQYCVKNQ